MKFLIDTHILIWALEQKSKLKPSECEILENRTNEIYISAASVWEMAIKSSIKKLTLPKDDELESELIKNDFKVLPIDFDLALSVKNLPLHHMDPFDRMIIATAQHYDLQLITHDPIFTNYPIKLFQTPTKI